MTVVLIIGIAFIVLGVILKIKDEKENQETDEAKKITATLVHHMSTAEHAQYVAQTTGSSFLRGLAQQAAGNLQYCDEDMAAEWYSIFEYEFNGETRQYVSKLPTAEPVGSTMILALTDAGEVKETAETRNKQSGAFVITLIGLSLLVGYAIGTFTPQFLNPHTNGLVLSLLSGWSFGMFVGAISIFIKIVSSQEVEATITDIHIEERHDDDGVHRYSMPVYTYYHSGKTHTVRSSTSSHKQIGEKQIIYVYKDGRIYEKRTAILLLIVGVILAVMLFITCR